MKIVNMRFMAMLVLGFLPIATKALNCSSPPVPATRAWVDSITSESGSDYGCTVVNGDLHLCRSCTAYNTCFGGSASLEGAVDLGAVETITGRLTCWGNPGITTVTANNLTNAGAVQISYTFLANDFTHNTLLTGFSFPALVNVSGDVHIWWNHALTSMDLGALQTVEGYLRIEYNDALTSMDLGALQTVEGYLYIGRNDNAALTSMDLGALQTVGGYLNLIGNDASTSIGLGALQTIEGDLIIWRNPALTSMGLGALQTIGGDLYIGGNDALTSMGLGALQTIGGDLHMRGNPALTSMGLGALQTIVGDLHGTMRDFRGLTSKDRGDLQSSVVGDLIILNPVEKYDDYFERYLQEQDEYDPAAKKEDSYHPKGWEDPDDPDASSDSDDVDVVNTAPRATGPTGAGAALLFLLPLLY